MEKTGRYEKWLGIDSGMRERVRSLREHWIGSRASRRGVIAAAGLGAGGG